MPLHCTNSDPVYLTQKNKVASMVHLTLYRLIGIRFVAPSHITCHFRELQTLSGSVAFLNAPSCEQSGLNIEICT